MTGLRKNLAVTLVADGINPFRVTLENPTNMTIKIGQVIPAGLLMLVAHGGLGPFAFEPLTIGDSSASSGLSVGTDGNITGTAAEVGTFEFIGTAQDANDEIYEGTFSVTIEHLLSWDQNFPPDGWHNQNYAYQFRALGGTGSTAYAVVSGSVPSGLDLSTDGLLDDGAIGAASGSVSNFTVRASDSGSGDSIDVNCSIHVYSELKPTIAVSSVVLSVGTPYTLSKTELGYGGGLGPFVGYLDAATPKPSGLSITFNSDGTATLLANDSIGGEVLTTATPTPILGMSNVWQFVLQSTNGIVVGSKIFVSDGTNSAAGTVTVIDSDTGLTVAVTSATGTVSSIAAGSEFTYDTSFLKFDVRDSLGQTTTSIGTKLIALLPNQIQEIADVANVVLTNPNRITFLNSTVTDDGAGGVIVTPDGGDSGGPSGGNQVITAHDDSGNFISDPATLDVYCDDGSIDVLGHPNSSGGFSWRLRNGGDSGGPLTGGPFYLTGIPIGDSSGDFTGGDAFSWTPTRNNEGGATTFRCELLSDSVASWASIDSVTGEVSGTFPSPGGTFYINVAQTPLDGMFAGSSAFSRQMVVAVDSGGDPYWSDVVLRLPCDETNGSQALVDAKTAITWNCTGSLATSNISPLCGPCSLVGVGNGQATPAVVGYVPIGNLTGSPCDWVFEFFIETVGSASDTAIATTSSSIGMYQRSNTVMFDGYGFVIQTGAISSGTKTHIALVYSVVRGNFEIYAAGVLGASHTAPAQYFDLWVIAGDGVGSDYYTGKLDDFRATNNTDRGYTPSGFTPPVGPFPTHA